MRAEIIIYDAEKNILARTTTVFDFSRVNDTEYLKMKATATFAVLQSGRAVTFTLVSLVDNIRKCVYEGKIGTRRDGGIVTLVASSTDFIANNNFLINNMELSASPSFEHFNMYVKSRPQGSLFD